MLTIMCRVGLCPKCKALGAEISDTFVAYGQDSQLYKEIDTVYAGVPGYTPHIYYFIELVGDTVFYKRACAMLDCGTYILREQNKMGFIKEAWSGVMPMPLREWTALEDFTDTGFEL